MSSREASPTRPRILFSRPDHLGDVLLTLPAVMTIRRHVPNALIVFLTAPGSVEIPRHCPDVDHVLTVPFPSITGEDNPPGWAETLEREAARLRSGFDIAILPRIDDPWSGALVAQADIPVRLGYDHPRTRSFLNSARPIQRSHVSELAQNLVLVALDQLGVAPQGPSPIWKLPCFVPDQVDVEEAMALLRDLAPTAGTSPIILSPGSGWRVKNWPVERWGALAKEISTRYGVAPLVSGGPSERDLVSAIVEASGGCAHGIAGRLSIGGLAALMGQARFVVGTDSGPLHLAAFMGTPVVGLYGPADPLEFGPLAPADRCRVVRVKLPCSPCGLLHKPPCGAYIEPHCVTGITVEMVMEVVMALTYGATRPLSQGGSEIKSAPHKG